MKAKVYRFKVEGNGEFPFDMMRYDACYPATESDSYLLSRHQHERRVVEMEHRSIDGYWRGPTAGRWNSFLWAVKEGPYSV